jgi:hypothetical protein
MGCGSENREFDPLAIAPHYIKNKSAFDEMHIPSNKKKQLAMAKLAARFVRRFGIHQNVRDYPVPPRFHRWREYFYSLLAQEIRRVQPPETFRWPVEQYDEHGLPLPPAMAYERVPLDVRYR